MSALIRVALSSPLAQLEPGERVDLRVTIQNMSEIVDRYTIAVEGIPPEWVDISRPALSLFPKDEDQVRITLRPPAGPATRAGYYDVRIRVTSQENPSERTAVALGLQIAALATLELQMRPLRQGGTVEGVYTLQVNNPGNTDLTVDFQASDPEEALDYLFDAARVALPAGQQRQVALRVRPRRAALARGARVYPFTVTARAAELPQQARQVQGEWEQTPPSFELALRPQKGRGTREGNFQLQVSNPGSVPLTLSFEATDPEEGCRYLFQPSPATVPPGEEARVQLTVRPRAPLSSEQSHTYTFTVTAALASGPPLTRQVQGQWEHLPPSFDLALRPSKEGTAGERAFEVYLTSHADTDMPVQVEVSDPQGAGVFSLYLPEALPVVIPAGMEVQMALLVRPRFAPAGQGPRPYTFTVRARPVTSGVAPQQVQGEWVHLPPAGLSPAASLPGFQAPAPAAPSGAATRVAVGTAFEMALRPPRVSGTNDGFFNLVLSNRGSSEVAALLQVVDTHAACRYSLYAIGTLAVLVPGGREVHFPLVVRPRAPLVGQEPKAHPFTVTARLSGPPRLVRQAQGEWRQLPTPAPIVPPLPAVPAPVPRARRKGGSGVAVAALVLGLLALLLVFAAVLLPVLAVVPLLLGLTAFILGLVGLGAAKRGMAIAGLILGLLAGLLAAAILVFQILEF